MSETIWIHQGYESQYDLLGAMAQEIHDALIATGRDARSIKFGVDRDITTGVVLFLNTPQTIDSLPPALFNPRSDLRTIQFHVDHPFALTESFIDQLSQRIGLDRYRLHLPCLDDLHLLRPRFEGMVHAWVPHGIPRSSLCDLSTITEKAFGERRFDVVVTGSVRTEQEMTQGVSSLPIEQRKVLHEIVRLMLQNPHLGYIAAVDLVLGTDGVITGDWKAQKQLWYLSIAILNRFRRIGTVQALQGLKVGVFGSAAWKEHCTGTIEYAGEVSYSECSSAFAQGRVGLAWGPTQFVHSYSERIMQAMAGGACTVCDDRLLVERDFPAGSHTRFDWADFSNARAAVDERLGDLAGLVETARAGREHVELSCLWEHRVEAMIASAEVVAGAC